MLRLLLIALILAGCFFLARQWLRTVGYARAKRTFIIMGGAGLLLLLTLRGSAALTLPLLTVLAPFLLRWWNKSTPSHEKLDAESEAESEVTTRFLKMYLDHATGELSGTVRDGHFSGRTLRDLCFQEWLELWQECQPDPQSVALLETWLDRYGDPDWREQVHATENAEAAASYSMDRVEAYRVLGLQTGASHEDIRAAYRRLIQRLHPDHGGSAWLATQLNRARDVLLDHDQS